MKVRLDPWPWTLGAIAIVTRVPFVPTTLYDFDAAAFAEAIESFEPLRFHPHPPGYTFYVLITKLIHALGTGPSAALGGASVGASAASTAAIYVFGRALGGRSVGIVASALFLASPLAWTYGAVQGTYGFGALGATVVAYLAWRRLDGATIRPAWLGLGSALAAGFRPDTAVVLSPLLMLSCALAPRQTGVRQRLAAIGEAALAGLVGLALWVGPAASASGSLDGYRAAVLRQWGAVAFSNAQDHFSSFAFRVVNLVKLATYGGFALGPVAGLMFPFALRHLWRSPRLAPAARVALGAWLLGYAGLAVGIAFGQPGMLLVSLPAACLTIALWLNSLPWLATVRRSIVAGAIATSAAVFLAPPLSAHGFFDAHASVASKVSTELFLFTRPGVSLVERELGGALDRLRSGYLPDRTVILTNVASSTRAMWALPGHHVACYFAFAGFAAPIPSYDVGEPRGTWSLPPRTRWLALLDADRHSISVMDEVGDRFRVSGGSGEAVKSDSRAVLRVFDLGGATAIRFRDGGIEAIGGTGARMVEAR